VSVRTQISGTTHLNVTKFSVHVACGYILVLLWHCSNTSCTSGFVDEQVSK